MRATAIKAPEIGDVTRSRGNRETTWWFPQTRTLTSSARTLVVRVHVLRHSPVQRTL